MDALARFTRDLLAYAPGTRDVRDAADAAPGDATLNAYAAATALFAMTPEAHDHARPYLDRARAAAHADDDRLLVDAVRAWAEGDRARAIALHRRRLAARPDDLAASKLAQLHYTDLGDFSGMVETIRLTAGHHAGNHYVTGQLAFALGEAGADAAAGRLAADAVAAADGAGADDPWSVHALLHAHHRAGRLAEVRALVMDREALWERCGGFLHVHAWWHAGLAALDLDRPGEALAVYDARLATAPEGCVQTLVARVALLARANLRGIDVGDRWAGLADALAARAGDGINGFLDVHYLYGLALAGRVGDAARGTARLGGTAAAAARALIDGATGRPGAALAALARLEPDLHRLGGSHEQREIYELAMLAAALRLGRAGEVRRLLARGRGARPAWQRRLLDRVAAAA